jgi:hypothetical protein
MGMCLQSEALRDGATLVGPMAEVHYLDARSMDLPRAFTPLEVWDRIMAAGLPGLKLAFRIRDRLARLGGIRPIGGLTTQRPAAPQAGDRLDFFTIQRITDEEMVLGVRDRHLDVIVSVLTGAQRLTITASVHNHNWLGRLYMIPVAPAHRLIVALMLWRLKRSLAAEARA